MKPPARMSKLFPDYEFDRKARWQAMLKPRRLLVVSVLFGAVSVLAKGLMGSVADYPALHPWVLWLAFFVCKGAISMFIYAVGLAVYEDAPGWSDWRRAPLVSLWCIAKTSYAAMELRAEPALGRLAVGFSLMAASGAVQLLLEFGFGLILAPHLLLGIVIYLLGCIAASAASVAWSIPRRVPSPVLSPLAKAYVIG